MSDINSIQALTRLVRSISDQDLKAADDDHIGALVTQLPRFVRKLNAQLEARGLIDKQPPAVSVSDLFSTRH